MNKQSVELCEVPKKKNRFRTVILRIGKRNFIIAACVLVLGLAVWLNWMLFSDPASGKGFDGYDQPSSLTDPDGSDDAQKTGADVDAKTTFFSATQVSRQRARDEALEVLRNVAEDEEAADVLKSEALSGIASIADEIQKEANIESLVCAKGFENCVAVLNGDKINVVVSGSELQPAQIAQINEAVYNETGILPANITIIAK